MKLLALIAVLYCASFGLSAQPVTGQSSAATAGIDQVMLGLLSKYSIPGAALAVSRNGVLVYARGFGYADTASSRPVQPDSLFRIASVSKTFTAMAILRLVEQGKIQLDQSAFGLLPSLTPLAGQTLNPELTSVTVRELLNMTGGWDRSIVPDPIDATPGVSAATGLPLPLSCAQVIQYQLGRPLQHAPGSTYAYSNFGYCVLGQIISQVSGMSYEDFVRSNVLKPLGIQRAKQADPLVSDAVNDEVTYYDYPGAPMAASAYSPGSSVPRTYGNHDFLATQASGGWVTTPIELLRFVNGIDGVRGGPLLQPATIQMMETEAPAFGGAATFYGLGFDIHTVAGGGFNWFKDGGLPGTAAYLYRGANKNCFAVVFNSAPPSAKEDGGDSFETDYVNQIETAIAAVTNWPSTDQFPGFVSSLKPPTLSASGPPVVNAASPHAGITPGSWVSIYGSNLATGSRTWYSAEFNGANLPTQIGSVSVTIGGVPAPVEYISPTQINVQAPLAGSTITSPQQILVTHDGQTSAVVPVPIDFSSPALFTYSGGGITWAAAENITGEIVGDPAVVPGTVKVKAGDYLILYCNSLLAAKSGTIVANPNTLQTFPTVTIGGISAPVSYAGYVSAGLFQINVQVPSGISAGAQPVVVTYNGHSSPANVETAIGQ